MLSRMDAIEIDGVGVVIRLAFVSCWILFWTSCLSFLHVDRLAAQTVKGQIKAAVQLNGKTPVAITLDVPAGCVEPAAYVVVEAQGIFGEIAVGEIGGQVGNAGSAAVDAVKALLPKTCQAYQGRLLLTLGWMRGRTLSWHRSFVMALSNGEIGKTVEGGFTTGSPYVERVDAEFHDKRRQLLAAESAPSTPSATVPELDAIARIIGAELVRNPVGYGHLISKLELGGPAFNAGLRTGDAITGVTGYRDDPKSLLADIERQAGSRHVPLIVQTDIVAADASVSPGARNVGTRYLVLRGPRDPKTFRTYTRRKDYALFDGTDEAFVRIATSPSSGPIRDRAAALTLFSPGVAMDRFRLMYLGDEDALRLQLEHDLGRISSLFAPVPGFSEAVRRNEPEARRARYAGLVAQYAIAKSQILGLCGSEAAAFEITTTRYAVYRNLLGHYRGRKAVETTSQPLVVAAEFRAAVEDGSSTGDIHPDNLYPINRFLNVQTCTSRMLTSLEKNMLDYAGGRSLARNPVPTLEPDASHQPVKAACEAYVSDLGSTLARRAPQFCGCVATRMQMMSLSGTTAAEPRSFASMTESGELHVPIGACVTFFE